MASAIGDGFLAGIPLTASTDQVIDRICPGPDACYYLTAGVELLDTGRISPANYWILNLWPPGVAVLSALYVAVARLGIWLPLAAGMINIAVWTLVLSAWYRFLRPRVGPVVSLGAVLLVAVGQPMREWYLGVGLFYVESISVALLLSAVLQAIRASSAPTRRSAIVRGSASGALFAAAAYLRAPYETAALVLTAATVVVFGFRIVQAVRLRSRGQLRRALRSSLVLISVVVAFHAFTMPWRVIAATEVRPGNIVWSTAGSDFWPQHWIPSSYLEEKGHYFLLYGLMNVPCRLEPAKCLDIFMIEVQAAQPYSPHDGEGLEMSEFRTASLQALLHNPVDWVALKSFGFTRFWFASGPGFELIENGLLLTLLGLVIFWRPKALGEAGWLIFFSLAIAIVGSSFLVHFETRYLYPLKSIAPVVGALRMPWILSRFRPHTEPID
ncbi:MAG: hypothetical protein WEA29_02910 [Acidimicrobiia bacterium]